MSNISRRDFMKTAGVMTLAVAASGVLAGCSTEEEVKPTVAGTLTVGDFTVAIASTKLYTHYPVASADDVSNNTKADAQYLVVCLTATTTKDMAKAKFDSKTVTVSAKNLTPTTDVSLIKKDEFSAKKDIKDGMGLKSAVASGSTIGESVLKTGYTLENGYKSWIVYEVTSNSGVVEGDVASFKTPSLTLYTQDGATITGSATASIPAATAVYKDKKKITTSKD